MRIFHVLWQRAIYNIRMRIRYRTHSMHTRYTMYSVHTMRVLVGGLLALLLAGCNVLGTSPAPQPTTTPTPVRINGFGTAANHTHSLVAFPNHVLLLATHYGLFRSSDDGKSWTMVAAGPGQLMDGLMTESLGASSLNPQRLYLLTLPAVSHAKGIVGLYTSSDQGKSWKLASSQASLGTMYLAQPGNDQPDEVYTYLPGLGALGLKVSMDAGLHFTAAGTLPFAPVLAMLAIPGKPGHLLIGGNDGMAQSSDGGAHWQTVQGISGAVFEITTAGANSPIYLSGDAGIYASQDAGKSFSLVYTKNPLNGLTVSPTQPQVLYGKTGTGVYRSSDGGHSWKQLPPIKGNLTNLVVDPTNAALLYLAVSYPTQVYQYSQASTAWSSLTPKA